MNCPNCKTPTGAPDWKARTHTLWANQHGNKVRVFCDKCGAWTDVETCYGIGKYDDTTMFRVVRQPNKENEG